MTGAKYIAQYLKDKGIKIAFGYPGGMVTFIVDAISELGYTEIYTNYHEQASAFAACGYTQVSQQPSLVFATSGPGATNLITGIAHAYFDSIPVIFITGQVNTNESKGNLKVRQKGFQETDIISIVKPITKFSKYVKHESELIESLNEAYHQAISGRPGPVLLDIPIDIQRKDIPTVKPLQPSISCNDPSITIYKDNALKFKSDLVNSLKTSKKPLFLFGNGVKISNTKEFFVSLTEKLNIPFVWSMIFPDIAPTNHRLNFGFIGSYGNRLSNFLVSTADLIITIGARLDIRQTGQNTSRFASDAKILRVDIDQPELDNQIHNKVIPYLTDLKILSTLLSDILIDNNFSNWLKKINEVKILVENFDTSIPNQLINEVSKLIPDNAIITTDVGQNQVWISQSYNVKGNESIIYSGGHGAMGFSFPAAIGAYYTNRSRPVISFNGDGGFQMNLQELQFVVREKIPLKIIIVNNKSLGMIRHFQEIYFDSRFTLTSENMGYSNPDFIKIANAYGIDSISVSSIQEIKTLSSYINSSKPVLIELMVGETTYTYPKQVFGKELYDQDPALPNELLQKCLNILNGN
jgi:acetolactate synthase-1/2/3 large subunit